MEENGYGYGCIFASTPASTGASQALNQQETQSHQSHWKIFARVSNQILVQVGEEKPDTTESPAEKQSTACEF